MKEQQIKRRTELLEQQKRGRNEKFSASRDLKEIFQQNKPKKNPRNKLFSNIVMLSEWMMTKPDDIEDFLIIPCPKGIRCSLVTGDHKNTTAASVYHKNGQRMMRIRTNLPTCTILDCIYNSITKTIYILDAIVYAKRDLVDCDASFRFYWLKSRFLEEDLRIVDDESNLSLRLLETYDFSDPSSVNLCFQTYPLFTCETDGFLFYHKGKQ